MSQATASRARTYAIPEVRVLPLASLVGRLLLSAIFILSGVTKFLSWEDTAGYMASQGIPNVNLLLPIAGAAEIAGGLSLALGWWARAGALGLFLFLIPATIVFHDFWTLPAAEQQNQMQHFLKNLAIMGGLATVFAFGAGPMSFDRWRASRRDGRRAIGR